MLSWDFENPSVVFSSVALAAICQGARYYSAYDKTMLAANAAAPRRHYGLRPILKVLSENFLDGGFALVPNRFNPLKFLDLSKILR